MPMRFGDEKTLGVGVMKARGVVKAGVPAFGGGPCDGEIGFLAGHGAITYRRGAMAFVFHSCCPHVSGMVSRRGRRMDD